MKTILIALLTLCACAARKPPPTPSDWSRGTPLSVLGPEDVDAGTMAGDEEGLRKSLLASLRKNLAATGFKLLPEAPLRLHLLSFRRNFLTARVERQSGPAVTELKADADNMPCYSWAWGAGARESNLECYGEEMARLLVGSPLVAAATREKPQAAPVERAAAAPSGSKLAVLELRNFAAGLSRENAQYFTDLVRSAALRMQPGLQVMTRENLLVLLKASGKSLDECEGECEVDTGRRIGADQIVSGELQKLGSLFKLSLRLHDTHEGRLLASTQASGRSVEELDQSAQKAAEDLLRPR